MDNKTKMIRIWTITPDKGLNPCTEKDIKGVLAWIEEAESGSVIEIIVGEMDETEYDELPEYMGP